MELSKGEVIDTLSFEVINQQLDGSCNESEKEIGVSNSSDNYFSDESDTKTINSIVASDKRLDNLARLEPLPTC